MKDWIASKVKNPLLRNILTYTITDGLSQAMPFLVLPVIAAYLSPEDFGRVTNFNVLVQLFLAIVGMRLVFLYSADYYRLSETDRSVLVSNIAYLMIFVSILVTIGLSIAHKQVLEALGLSIKWQLLAVLMVFFLSIGQLYTTQLRLREKAILFAKVQFFRSFTSAALSLLFVVGLDWSWQGRVYGMFITAAVLMSISLVSFVKQKMLFSKFSFSQQKALLAFGLPLLPYALAPWLMSGVQKIVITSEVSLAQNGIYSLTGTLVAVFSMVSSSFFSAYTPHLYKKLSLSEEDKEAAESRKVRLIQEAYTFMLVLFGLLLIGYWAMFLLIEYVMPAEYNEALVFLPLLMLAVAFSAVGNLFKSYIIYTKKTAAFGAATFTVAVIQVFITFWFVKNYGTIGAAYANLISGSLIMFIAIYLGQRFYPMPWIKALSTISLRK